MFCEYLLLFYLASIGGWIWEAVVFWISHGFSYSLPYLVISYRGVLHGTWAPIYGVGFILLVLLWNVLRKRKIPFYVGSIISCAAVEYGTAWILEELFHAKWWDYSNAFLNLNGKICFVSVVGFGIVGAAAVIQFMPVFQKAVNQIPAKILRITCIILSAFFLLDTVCSAAMPNMGLGVLTMG